LTGYQILNAGGEGEKNKMDIEAYVEEKCPHRLDLSPHGIHDRAYEQALRRAYHHYKDMTIGKLQVCQEIARDQFRTENSSHRSVANCMIIMELIKEKENEK